MQGNRKTGPGELGLRNLHHIRVILWVSGLGICAFAEGKTRIREGQRQSLAMCQCQRTAT